MSFPSYPRQRRQTLAAFIVLGFALTAVYGTLAIFAGPRSDTSAAMALALLAFTLYLGALYFAGGLDGKVAWALAAALGLAARALLFAEPPLLSDDHFRYLWDGLVQLRGVNPYRYAPADSALAAIDEGLRSQVNHPTVHSIYPPLAQLVFAVVASLSASWLVLKCVWLACDVAIAALLLRLVPEPKRLQAWTLYWWSPLVIIEVAWNAHLDLLGVLMLVAAIKLARDRRPQSAMLGVALAGAALVKYFALLLAPAAARRGRPAQVLTAFGLAVVVLYLPYAGAGPRLFAGLAAYAGAWRFNDGLFALLAWLTPSLAIAKLAAAAILLAAVAQSARSGWTLERTALWVVGTILALSPTVHPWYLLWIVPLLALRANRAWLYLSGSVFLAYYGLATYRAEGFWPEPWWTKLLIYGPFFMLLITDAWQGFRLRLTTSG